MPTEKMDHRRPRPVEWWPDVVRAAVVAGLGAIAVLELLDEVAWRRRRAARALDGWWARLQLRERRHVRGAEVDYLARVLRPR